MLNYSILLKKISKSIGNEITEDMDLLKVIDKVTTNTDVKSIINSVNDNQIKNKLWVEDCKKGAEAMRKMCESKFGDVPNAT